MPSYTWTAITSGGTTAWSTPAAWFNSADSTNQIAAGFTTAPGADYLVNGSNIFTIDDIGAGGTATPDVANSLIVSDPLAKLLFADPGGALDIATILSLAGLLNLGTVTGGSILSMGSTGAAGGTITLSASGSIKGGLGDSIQNLGTSPTEISGSGIIQVPANDGIFNIGTGVQVASTGAINMTFSIGANATLSFTDAVGGGTVVFSATSASGVLDVGDLSSFNPTGIKNLHVGVGANTETTVIDLIHAGTAATATLSDESTTGATLNVFANGTSHTIPLIGNFTTVVGEPGKSVNVNYLSDGVGGTDIFLSDTACFRAGTRILTPTGDVPIEALAIGEVVLTRDGTAKPIKWIGRCGYGARFVAANPDLLPIRIAANALADGVPNCDLDVSPKHAVYINDVLVPAERLVNGISIYRVETVQDVEYFHVELAEHDVIFAAGAATESYVDCNNRGMFHNVAEYAELYPADDGAGWAFCAPRVEDGEALARVRCGLDQRLALCGHITTLDPDLRLLVDGVELRAEQVIGCRHRFRLRQQPRDVRMVSRSSIPAEMQAPSSDRRRLGVSLLRLVLSDADATVTVKHPHPLLSEGFHATEATHRWTDGSARIPPELFASFSDGCVAEVVLRDHSMPYYFHPQLREATAVYRPRAAAQPDRSKSRRVLLIEDRIPAQSIGSGYTRTADILHAMTDAGTAVLVWPLHQRMALDALPWMRGAWSLPPQITWPDTVGDLLRQQGEQFDVVWVCRSHNYRALRGDLLRWRDAHAGRRLVVDTEAIEALRTCSMLERAGRPMPEEDLLSAIQTEMPDLGAADAVVAVNRRDAAALTRAFSISPVIIGHRLGVAPSETDFVERSGLLFVGALYGTDTPNYDSLKWFIEKIFPEVVAQIPGTRFNVIGHQGQAVPPVTSPYADLIDWIGEVADLSVAFAAARVFVAPTRYAGGLPHKVENAAAHGLPVVVTPLLAEQLGHGGEEEFWVRPDGWSAEEFAARVVALYCDHDLWQKCRDQGLRHVARRCSPKEFDATVVGVVNGWAGHAGHRTRYPAPRQLRAEARQVVA